MRRWFGRLPFFFLFCCVNFKSLFAPFAFREVLVVVVMKKLSG